MHAYYVIATLWFCFCSQYFAIIIYSVFPVSTYQLHKNLIIKKGGEIRGKRGEEGRDFFIHIFFLLLLAHSVWIDDLAISQSCNWKSLM